MPARGDERTLISKTEETKTLESRYRPWIDAVAELGYEEVMIDEGWWGERYPPKSHPENWPSGMKAAADYAHGKGLRFGLYLDKTADYDSIKYLYDNYGADLYRSDRFGIPSVHAFYDTLDRLQRDIPTFQYENCNNGGRIKDFGVMKRAVKIFVTDTYSALDIQRAWHDASYVFPPIQIMGNVGGRLRGVSGAVYSFRTSAQGAPEWFAPSPSTIQYVGGRLSAYAQERVRRHRIYPKLDTRLFDAARAAPPPPRRVNRVNPRYLISSAGQVGALAFMIASLMALNRSVGVVAANRGIKTRGPYAWVRHPLYAGEIPFDLSFLVSNWSYANGVLVLIITLAQVVRSFQEENFLLRDNAYALYRTTVPYRLVPRVL